MTKVVKMPPQPGIVPDEADFETESIEAPPLKSPELAPRKPKPEQSSRVTAPDVEDQPTLNWGKDDGEDQPTKQGTQHFVDKDEESMRMRAQQIAEQKALVKQAKTMDALR